MPRVDPRVERLDPAVEHLREAGDGGDVGHRQAGVAQRARRATGRDELEPASDEAAAELDQAGLVRDRQQRATRVGIAASARSRSTATRRPPDGTDARRRARARRPAAAAGARPPGSGRGASSRRRRAGPATASWATIGPPSRVASTRWTVQPVTFTPWASASSTACGARERRQQRRVRVQDPAVEGGEDRRPDDAHVAGEHDDVDAGAPSSVVGRAVASSPPGTSAVSIPCSAAQSSAGQARSAKTRTISPPSSPRRRRRDERPQVRAGARDADRDRGRSRTRPRSAASSRRSTYRAPPTRMPRRPRRRPRRRCRRASKASRSPPRPRRRQHDDHPEAAVERRPQLVVVEAAERPEEPHHRRHRPARRVEPRAPGPPAGPAARCRAARRR